MDPSSRALTFLRYGEKSAVIDALESSRMEPEKLRLNLLFSLRHSRAIVINMDDCDVTSAVKDYWNKLSPGLWDKIVDRSITKLEK